MTRFEWHACDAENEILRSQLKDTRETARSIAKAIGKKARYFTASEIANIKSQLQSIISQ